jgi:hypothetical protein
MTYTVEQDRDHVLLSVLLIFSLDFLLNYFFMILDFDLATVYIRVVLLSLPLQT